MYRLLHERYPYAHCELDFRTPLELLVATILSAQTTDVTVNRVTPVLFERYRTAADYGAADRAEMEAIIKPTGFYRAKTNSLIQHHRERMEVASRASQWLCVLTA